MAKARIYQEKTDKLMPLDWSQLAAQEFQRSSTGSKLLSRDRKVMKGNVHGRLIASWKICSLAVNGQSFLVIDGYLLNSLSQSFTAGTDNRRL